MRLSLVVGLFGALTLAIATAPALARGGPKGGGGPPGWAAGGPGGSPPGFASRGRHLGFAQGQPRGWSKGKKTGWRCTVGSAGCIPPGLR
jgi:hypothetical protein